MQAHVSGHIEELHELWREGDLGFPMNQLLKVRLKRLSPLVNENFGQITRELLWRQLDFSTILLHQLQALWVV